jgi:hypothetical protein
MILSIISSIAATYLYVDHEKQIQMKYLTQYYENQIENLESAIMYYNNYTNNMQSELDSISLELYHTNQSLQENLSELGKL